MRTSLFSRLPGMLAAVAVLAGCAATDPRAPSPSPEPARGFLPKEALIGGSILPAPPAAGSAAHAADEAAYREARRLVGSRRWERAARDADVRWPGVGGTMSCALGLPIDPSRTPQLYVLLRRSFIDAGLAGSQAKAAFPRTRPFVADNGPICTPELTSAYRTDPSYPSSNAVIGWAWALILSELVPERMPQLLERGRSWGESRAVCGVHWQSDLAAGRLLGAAVVAQLHSDTGFRAQLDAARREVDALKASGAAPAADCAAEAEALRAR